jgi:hypothetical protein
MEKFPIHICLVYMTVISLDDKIQNLMSPKNLLISSKYSTPIYKE